MKNVVKFSKFLKKGDEFDFSEYLTNMLKRGKLDMSNTFVKHAMSITNFTDEQKKSINHILKSDEYGLFKKKNKL